MPQKPDVCNGFKSKSGAVCISLTTKDPERYLKLQARPSFVLSRNE